MSGTEAPKRQALPLVVVAWDDAWTDENSVTLDNVRASHKPIRVHTIGWLLLDDDVGVSIANEYYDSTYRGRTFILRSMVRSVEPFVLNKPPKPRAKKVPVVLEGAIL